MNDRDRRTVEEILAQQDELAPRFETECFVCHRVRTMYPTGPIESRWSLCKDCDRP